MLPEDSLCRYLCQSDDQHGDQKKALLRVKISAD